MIKVITFDCVNNSPKGLFIKNFLDGKIKTTCDTSGFFQFLKEDYFTKNINENKINCVIDFRSFKDDFDFQKIFTKRLSDEKIQTTNNKIYEACQNLKEKCFVSNNNDINNYTITYEFLINDKVSEFQIGYDEPFKIADGCMIDEPYETCFKVIINGINYQSHINTLKSNDEYISNGIYLAPRDDDWHNYNYRKKSISARILEIINHTISLHNNEELCIALLFDPPSVSKYKYLFAKYVYDNSCYEGKIHIPNNFFYPEGINIQLSLSHLQDNGEIISNDSFVKKFYPSKNYDNNSYNNDDYNRWNNDDCRGWSCDACGGDSSTGCLSSSECYR